MKRFVTWKISVTGIAMNPPLVAWILNRFPKVWWNSAVAVNVRFVVNTRCASPAAGSTQGRQRLEGRARATPASRIGSRI